jgi:16S rRNA (adenine1518-N6/adenine1519-N6)-dimethyltransferase
VRTLTPTEVRDLLDRHGLAPRKRAGQNFVVDPNTVRRIVAAAGLAADDVVLEVGPGLGSLTVALADVVGRVVAVEIDAGLVGALAEVLADTSNVEVVHADALRVDLAALVDGGPARLVANLPYNVATAIVVDAMTSGAFRDAFVMVQREVGERWAARPGDRAHAGVSVRLALVADVDVVLAVPRTVFLPMPNVDSVMVRLVRREDALGPERYAEVAAVVDRAFSTRRKALRNALAAPGLDVEAVCRHAGVDPASRAERLDAAAFVRLADALAAASADASAGAGAGPDTGAAPAAGAGPAPEARP